MHTESSVQIQRLLDRLEDGQDDALAHLASRAHHRLRRLAQGILRHSFPSVQARHELDSVLHEAWPRIFRAVEQCSPPTVSDFTRLAAHKIRQTLLDLADRQRLRDLRERSWNSDQPAAQTQHDDPSSLALWTEVHLAVESLPDPERRVFESCYYLGLSQAEAASLLNLPPRQVSRLWVSATSRLADQIFDAEDSGNSLV